jgi:CheY-like chemotaxis protein
MHEKAPEQGRTTVVYIEADPANALLMKSLLGARPNYALHHAADGRSGLELCQRVRPDLVITEMHLPDMTAYDVLRNLRNDAATQGLPCIVLSGDAMPGHIDRALATGFDGYWTKPVDIWHLLKNIDDAATNANMRISRQRSIKRTTASGHQAGKLGIRSGASLQKCRLPV